MTTTADQEAAFQRHLQMTTPYFDAVRLAGDLAWFEHGHPRRGEVVTRLGLSDDIDETELRRALFMRRHQDTRQERP